MTVFDESIFGPIHKKKVKSGLGLEAGIIAPPKAYKSRKSSKPSAFELMMKSFERERQRERDRGCDKRKDCRREKKLNGGEGSNTPALKNMEWKNFINGVKAKSVRGRNFKKLSSSIVVALCYIYIYTGACGSDSA
jgi:hypothetical protein